VTIGADDRLCQHAARWRPSSADRGPPVTASGRTERPPV